MKSHRSKVRIIVTFLFFLIYAGGLNRIAAQNTDKMKKWNFLTDIYLMFPYIDGETGIGENLILPVDATPGDIFSKLKMGAMLYFEAKTEKWAITSDLVYMKLNQEVTPGTLFHSGDVSASQLIWEPAGLYRVFPFLELGMGGRLNNISLDIDARRYVPGVGNPTEPVTENGAMTWFDPIIITRLTGDIKDKWLFQFRGDIGGFGIGSELTWQLHASAGYRFKKLFQITAGYRIISIDYNKTTGSEPFVFDIDEFGPEIRFGFNF